jgi:flagellar hook-associated protein 1
VLAETAPQGFNRLAIGSGVEIKSVQEFRDRFIESRLQSETGISGRLTARRDVLATVETALQGSASGGLENAINGFFGSFRDLDANPNSAPLRTIVAQKASALASAFQTTRSRLDDIRHGADEQIRTAVDDVNALSEKIAVLNGQIAVADNTNSNGSALRDQRAELVNQLSELTGARSTENGDGTINLTIGEGRALVNGTFAATLDAQTSPPLGLATLTLDGQPAVFDEGKIKGLQEAIGETGAQIGDLDELAAQVVARVNALHQSGADLDGNPGTNLFNAAAPVTAQNISINPAVAANPRLVVASALAPPSQSGTVAGAIANLLTDQSTTVNAHTGSFSSIFGSMLSEAGQQVAAADNDLQTQGYIISQISAQRDAVSGVSLDEEAINLLQYQRAFEAAARFLKVADEMTQTILSLAQ